jgi:hypothetical protein
MSRNDGATGAHREETSTTRYAERNWATYESAEERVTIALRRWVEMMEEALARNASGATK